MIDGLQLSLPALLPLALLPTLREWVLIGVAGAVLFFGRRMLAGSRTAGGRARVYAGWGERVYRLRIPICIGIAVLSLTVGLELIREGRWEQGTMSLLSAGAAAMLASNLGRR